MPFADSLDASSRPLWPEGYEALPVDRVEQHDLTYAGARPADRTANDERIVQEIRNRAGNDRLTSEYEYWVGHHSEVGGYPELAETAHQLTVPDTGLRQWLDDWALAVEEPDVQPPGSSETGATCGGQSVNATATVGGSGPNATTVCDVSGDDLYRDVNADGDVGQTDVVEFFGVQHREAWKRPELFDFSGNDAVGHGDVVSLFEYAARNTL